MNYALTAAVSGLATMWVACTPFGSRQSWARCVAVFIMGAVVGAINYLRGERKMK